MTNDSKPQRSSGSGTLLAIVAGTLVAAAVAVAVTHRDGRLRDVVAENDRLATENARLRQLVIGRTEAGRPSKPERVAPSVAGVVLDTKRTGTSNLVEISVGSDDGLEKNDVLFVSRGEEFKQLGRIKLVLTTPDRAVGTVLQTTDGDSIRQGDAVTTKL